MWGSLVALLIGLLASSASWDFRLLDAAGRAHTAAEWKDKKAVVLLFVSTDCPISNRYAPVINRIGQEYSAKNIAFYLVQSDPDLTPRAAAAHAREYGFTMPVLMDPLQQLASKSAVAVTPTAIVLVNGAVRYRGRIDDRNVDFGKSRTSPRKEDLKLALNAVLTGQAVSEPNTRVIGCFLPPAKNVK